MAETAWKRLVCKKSQLCLDTVLACGQSFRWKQNKCGEWLGVLAGRVWRLQQTQDHVLYQVYSSQQPCPENGGARSVRESSNEEASFQKSRQECNGRAGRIERVKHATARKVHIDKTCTVISKHMKKESLTGLPNKVSMAEDDARAYESACHSFKPTSAVTEKGQYKEEKKTGTIIGNVDVMSIKTISESNENLFNSRRKRVRKDNIDLVCGCDVINPISKSASTRDEKTEFNGKKRKLSQKSKLVDVMDASTASDCSQVKALAVDNVKSSCIQNDQEEVLDADGRILWDYFQLDVDLEQLYNHWSRRDPHFLAVARVFEGVRILKQDPVENLISFVCSSNNHISRISAMVEKLCVHYGSFVAKVDGEDYFTFPSFSALNVEDLESHLRQLGFGYRAKFIANITKDVTEEKGEGWLESLRWRSYEESKKELMSLMGVGAKVADCVCLMSLGHPGTVPVDTHVWQIASKNYLAKLRDSKSLTEKLYNEIGDFFRNLWGPYAGWAHSVLFAADLKHNQDRMKHNPDKTKHTQDGRKKVCDVFSKGKRKSKV